MDIETKDRVPLLQSKDQTDDLAFVAYEVITLFHMMVHTSCTYVLIFNLINLCRFAYLYYDQFELHSACVVFGYIVITIFVFVEVRWLEPDCLLN